MQAVLVTGGCGFIGRAVVASLLADGARFIRVVDNLSNGQPQSLQKLAPTEESDAPRPPGAPIQLVVGDIRDGKLARSACEGIDAVVHLAANTGVPQSILDPLEDCTANIVGTVNYLEGARAAGIRRFVLASSAAAAGDCAPPVHEDVVPHPISPYGASKLAGEAYCSAYAASYGMSAVALRFGNVYGPGSDRKQSVVAKFIREVLAGEAIVVHGDGTQARDFIYIDDLVRAIRRSLVADDIAGQVFQIATARGTSILRLVQDLDRAFRACGHTPMRVTFGPRRPGDVQENFADTSKALQKLGWRAEVELADGLARTVRWALGHMNEPS
jgi:UDP-glucose 4-epimerase